MLVTGVQSAGAKSLAAVQVAVVDPKDVSAVARATERERDLSPERRPDPLQPVVFMRDGLPLDQRPVSQRMHEAESRYRSDGGGDDGDGSGDADRDGDGHDGRRNAPR